MKKQLCTLCLALLLLIPGAGTFCSAAEAERAYTCSDWAETDVFSALYYGLARAPYGGDYRQPIQRQAFGENAAALVARTYGTDLDLYLNVTSFRLQKAAGWGTVGLYDPVLAVAKELGILQGREDGSLDGAALITRQEAAVILARTYRACMGKVPDALSPLSYDDSAQTITDCCDTLLFLGGKSSETNREISEAIGKQTLATLSVNDSRGSNSSTTRNYAKGERDLMQASEVGRLPRDEAIVMISGTFPMRDKKFVLEEHPRYASVDPSHSESKYDDPFDFKQYSSAEDKEVGDER